MTRPLEIFVSYAQEDRRRAASLLLAMKPLLPALSPDGAAISSDLDLALGENWADALDKVIRRSDVFVVLLSPSYLESSTAQYELGFILSEQRDRGGLVLPVVLKKTWLGMMARFQTIDACGKPADWVAARIADAVKRQETDDTTAIVAHA